MDKFLIKTNKDLPIYKRKLFWIASFFIILFVIIIIIVIIDTSKNDEIIVNNNSLKFIPYICLDEKKLPSKKCIGGWFYKTTLYTPEYNAKFAKSKNWNYVLLSANIKEKKIIEIINAFRKQNISVHFMTLQDIKYLDDPESAYNKIKEILIFVNNNNLDIQGIHIDVEPHSKIEWKNGGNEIRTLIFQNYTKVLENCRKAINEYRSNITFSAAVAWFYSSKTKKNEIIGGRGYDLVNENRLDYIFPMVYSGAGGTLKDILKHTEDYITDNANLVIGISVKEHNETLNEITNQIIEKRKNSTYFYGISIFSNNYYNDWGNEIN